VAAESKAVRKSGCSAAAVATWRNGLCVDFKGYVHKEEALRDLGVSEDTLEPIAP
jgi:hypothetical protein